MKKVTLVILVVMIVGLPSLAQARKVEIAATQIATIEPADKSEGARILVQWTIPAALASKDKSIEAAFVTMTLSYNGNGPFEVDVLPLTKQWSANTVGWSSGWSEDGGDYNADLPSPAIVTVRDGGKISADVRHVVREIIAGNASNFGFIVVPESTATARLSTFEANATAKLADAKLIIVYRERR